MPEAKSLEEAGRLTFFRVVRAEAWRARPTGCESARPKSKIGDRRERGPSRVTYRRVGGVCGRPSYLLLTSPAAR
jgi:hypothetical protein